MMSRTIAKTSGGPSGRTPPSSASRAVRRGEHGPEPRKRGQRAADLHGHETTPPPSSPRSPAQRGRGRRHLVLALTGSQLLAASAVTFSFALTDAQDGAGDDL